MAQPFIGEIKMFSFQFAPRGWAFCQGQLLAINQNQALFSLLGTNYGGNGIQNFALPELRGRTPIHVGNGRVLGERAGEENHTLIVSETPAHTHTAVGSSNAPDAASPAGNYWSTGGNQIFAGTQNATMNPVAVGNAGGSQAHPNMPPYLVLNFCIALQGIFPSRS